MLNRTLDVPVIFLAGLCWLWLAMRVMDFGVQWQSVSTVRHQVTVTLPNDQTLTGDVTTAWDRSYRLADMSGRIWHFRAYKMMTIPREGQAPSAFPFRTVLPFLLFFVSTMIAIYHLGFRTPKRRD